ncbi:MAG: GIY-YIG nuclease family protein, partial [Gemmatimonadaceae bacterium]
MSRSGASVDRQPTSDAQLAIMRSTVREGAADRPGVYRMLSGDGEVLYVGKSKQVRTRLLSYFRCAYPEEKGARILRSAEKIEWDYTPSEFAALLQELRQIKRFRPRYNVAMKRDGRNYAFIKLTKAPAPKLIVVRGPTGEDADTYYGPFVGAQRVDEALRELNDALMLRDCRADMKMFFNDQTELFQLART